MNNALDPLKFRQDVTIETLSLDHACNMFRWMCDPFVSRNLGLRNEPSLERTKKWITNALQDPSIRSFAVLFNRCHVGNVILDRIDNYLATARLSVYIGEPSARGSGVGLTGIYLVLLEGFLKLNLHKIWLTVHPRNMPAISTYSRLGFMQEGVLRDEFWLDGRRSDILYFGLLKADFELLPTV